MKPNYIIILALCTTLNASAQTDATKYISNPSFETGGLSKWKSSGLQVQGNSSFSKKNGSVYVEKWVSKGSNVGDASVSQVITNLPLGKYTLTVAAQNLNEASTSEQCSGAYIYAGDQKTDDNACDKDRSRELE